MKNIKFVFTILVLLICGSITVTSLYSMDKIEPTTTQIGTTTIRSTMPEKITKIELEPITTETTTKTVETTQKETTTKKPTTTKKETTAKESVSKENDDYYTIRCKITHYCPCATCNGNSSGITAMGTKLQPYYTCAVDKSVIPLGSIVEINGNTYHAEDTGVRGNTIDICVGSHSECYQKGVYYADVKIYK